MNTYLQDADLTLYQGDALEVLRTLPDESVHMCVTSPPFYGLRDYGTGRWEGGNPDCDHLGEPFRTKAKLNENWAAGFQDVKNAEDRQPFKATCGKCGASRVDQQIGLEATPEEWCAKLVAVFREVRRVLRADGTCWVEVGDSYAGGGGGNYGSSLSSKQGGQHLTNVRNKPEWLQSAGFKAKDLIGAPWMLAFALRADGWYLRSDVVWARPNPMPESVTDRPTKSHSYVFLLSKSARYFFDQEAVREPHTPDGRIKTVHDHLTDGSHPNYDNIGNGNERWPNSGRNVRSVWTIATEAYPDAHFATYPQELVRRCILAGTSERGCCPECGAPWARETEVDYKLHGDPETQNAEMRAQANSAVIHGGPQSMKRGRATKIVTSKGWLPTCECGTRWGDKMAGYPIPCTVLDPFAGSGTTGLVARKHGRRSILIELSEVYAELASKRLNQLSLFSEIGRDDADLPSVPPASGTTGIASEDSQAGELA